MDVILFDPLFIAPPNDVELFWLLEFDRFEMDRSNRRGGENSARLDFSMRREMSPLLDEQAATPALWLGASSCVGLKNSARLDVSRVAVPNFGAACSIASGLFPLFFNDDGVLRPKHFFLETIDFYNFHSCDLVEDGCIGMHEFRTYLEFDDEPEPDAWALQLFPFDSIFCMQKGRKSIPPNAIIEE